MGKIDWREYWLQTCIIGWCGAYRYMGAERTISVLNQTHFSDTRENGILSGVRFLFLSAISLLKEVLHGVGRFFLQCCFIF